MKRFTATEKWQKDWFQSLTPGQKCLWNYLCDNCDAAGVWEPNWRLASFVINETFTRESLAIFGERVRAMPDGKIWLTGFCEFQYSQLSRECRRAHAYHSYFGETSSCSMRSVHLLVGAPDNPSDTLWYRVPDRDKEKDKDKEQDHGYRPDCIGATDRPKIGKMPASDSALTLPGQPLCTLPPRSVLTITSYPAAARKMAAPLAEGETRGCSTRGQAAQERQRRRR